MTKHPKNYTIRIKRVLNGGFWLYIAKAVVLCDGVEVLKNCTARSYLAVLCVALGWYDERFHDALHIVKEWESEESEPFFEGTSTKNFKEVLVDESDDEDDSHNHPTNYTPRP